jgi:hypothetical protein
MGVIIGSAVLPIAFSITWKKCSAAISGAALGQAAVPVPRQTACAAVTEMNVGQERRMCTQLGQWCYCSQCTTSPELMRPCCSQLPS